MTRKYISVLGLVLGAALTAQANYMPVDDYLAPGDQSDASIIASIHDQLGLPDLPTVQDLLRLNGNLTVASGDKTGFTFSSPGVGQLRVNWDLTDRQLGFIYIYGGGNANLYEIEDVPQATKGNGLFITPANLGGQIPAISHVLFLGWPAETPGPGPGVPDGGSTLVLLGLGVIAINGIRRLL